MHRSRMIRFLCFCFLILCPFFVAASKQLHWELIGPQGAMIRDFFFDLEDKKIVMAHAGDPFVDAPAFYRSADEGRTWSQIRLPWEVTIAIRKHPTANQVFYALGIKNGRPKFLISSDGGLRWKPFASVRRDQIFKDFAFHPLQPQILYAINDTGFYISRNAGKTWTLKSRAIAGSLIRIHPQNGKIIYVLNDPTLYRTTNEGTTWESVRPQPGYVGFRTIEIDRNEPRTLYTGSSFSILKSTDSGKTFFQLDSPCGGTAISVDPENSSNVQAGGGGAVCRSTDGGNSWKKTKGLITVWETPRVLATHPLSTNLVFLGGGAGEGVFRSANGGGTWRESNRGINQWPVFGVRVHPARPDRIFARGNVGQIYKTEDGGKKWKPIPQIMEDYQFSDLQIHPQNPDLIVAASEWTIGISKDGGKSWQYSHPPVSHQCCIRGIRLDPSNQSIIYLYLGQGLLVSKDQGKSWNALRVNVHDGFVQDFQIDPRNAARIIGIFGSNEYEMAISENGGSTWNSVQGIAHDIIGSVAFHPHTSNQVLALGNGWIWESMDGGRSWKQKSTSLQLNRIEWDPVTPNQVFGIGFNTIFVSKNAGQTWKPFDSTGLENITFFTELKILPTQPKVMLLATSSGVALFPL